MYSSMFVKGFILSDGYELKNCSTVVPFKHRRGDLIREKESLVLIQAITVEQL